MKFPKFGWNHIERGKLKPRVNKLYYLRVAFPEKDLRINEFDEIK